MNELKVLQKEIKVCTVCRDHLPLGPRPVFSFSKNAKVLIIGQAPGSVVHQSGIPWMDASGRRLRDWMGINEEVFYNSGIFAIIPMGFCYPGKGKSGDLPPRPECAPLWHQRIIETLPNIKYSLLIGQYAQQYYLGDRRKNTLTETVKAYREYLPQYFPIVHPSPRNQIWMKKNPWFAEEVVPQLRQSIQLLNK